MDILDKLRLEYSSRTLDESGIDKNPFEQFKKWLDEAFQSKLIEPYAMSLSTVNSDGQPSARIVLLRGVADDGFRFFTNFHSRKSMEIEHNNKASLLFFWPELERQVRVEGTIEKLPASDSDKYFKERPRGSQIGAIASDQSATIANRAELEKKFKEFEKKFEGKDIPRPDHWGGYRLVPSVFEFWQGRPNRLHDRIEFKQTAFGWKNSRLAP